jgi:hypothetical protein
MNRLWRTLISVVLLAPAAIAQNLGKVPVSQTHINPQGSSSFKIVAPLALGFLLMGIIRQLSRSR